MPTTSCSTAVRVPDARLFDALLKEHHPRVYRFAYRLTGCRLEAEDLAQDAFIRAHTAFHRYDPARPFEQWILRITYRLFIDRLRRRKQVSTYSLDELRESADSESQFQREIPDNTTNPEAKMMEATMDERLEKALSGMPEPFRRAIMLADVEGMSYDEIAQNMQCSAGTVRSRIHRGRMHLRKALQIARQTAASLALMFAPALATVAELA